MRHCAKVVLNNSLFKNYSDCNFSDVMIAADASGGSGTCYHPHFHSHNKNEIQRRSLLRVHCMFVKIHGFGVLIYRGVCKFEATNGANFTVECIYKALRYYLLEKRKSCPNHQIRNVGIQMDNAKGNKAWTMFLALCALVSYGVCVKTKLSFGLANHNHTDIDSNIASTILSKLVLYNYNYIDNNSTVVL